MKEEISKYNKKGKITYKKIDGIETWYEYDKKGREISVKSSDGYIKNTKYHKNIQESYYKYSGKEEIIKYDDKGRMLYHKFPTGEEEIYKYDKKHGLIYHKFPTGEEKEFRYDEKGRLIYHKYNSRDEENIKYYNGIYNNKMKSYQRLVDGKEMEFRINDRKGRTVYERKNEYRKYIKYCHDYTLSYTIDHEEEIFEKFDKNNNILYYKNSNGTIKWRETFDKYYIIYTKGKDRKAAYQYDKKNNLISVKRFKK